MIKLCKDCIHHEVEGASLRNEGINFCKHPKATIIDYVNGKHRQQSCKTMRTCSIILISVDRCCGKEGEWFEPREQ